MPACHVGREWVISIRRDAQHLFERRDALGKQALANLIVGVYSFVVAFGLGKLIDKTIGFRLPEDDEVTGIDQVEHAETAYDFLSAGSGLRGPAVIRTAAPVDTETDAAEKEGAKV